MERAEFSPQVETKQSGISFDKAAHTAERRNTCLRNETFTICISN